MQLIDLKDLKIFLDKTKDDNKDILLLDIIKNVSAVIQSQLNRKLEKKEYTQKFYGGYTDYYLNAYPVDLSEDLTLEEVPIIVTNYTEEYTLDTDYHIDTEEGIINFVYETTKHGYKSLTVRYIGGYEKTGDLIIVPDDLKHACLLQCAFEFKSMPNIGTISVSYPDAGISIKNPVNLLDEVKLIIRDYRKPAGTSF